MSKIPLLPSFHFSLFSSYFLIFSLLFPSLSSSLLSLPSSTYAPASVASASAPSVAGRASLPPRPAAPPSSSCSYHGAIVLCLGSPLWPATAGLRSCHSRGKGGRQPGGAPRSRAESRFVAPPPQWKSEGAPGAAPCLELLQNGPFDRAPAGAGFWSRSPAKESLTWWFCNSTLREFSRNCVTVILVLK